MKRKNSVLKVFLLVILLGLGICCSQTVQAEGLQNSTFSAKPKITLNKQSVTLNLSKTKQIQLKATVQGKNSKVTWKSSKPSVASVNSNGKVTAKKVGTTTITAKANGVTTKCIVTVKKTKQISKSQAINKVKSKMGKQLSYVCMDNLVSYKGKKYYVIYVKAKVGNHYSTVTQYLVSLDGKVCREGYYYSGKVGFY